MKINVSHVAKLANLPLTDEEKKKFENQLSSVLKYVEKLREVDTSKVEETSQVTGLENVLREDQAAPSLSQGDALKNAKSKHNGLFKVPAILDE
ncbi:MAG: asparaginyl/glutamyl-tRNA amidotransferase subunit C [Candidatus Levybacteria bacterium RIFCSPLOWO2_02_FULL_37_18]|nr:MAG: asparaginyl/glutamyl-tRNA amidotransferase subunit C [Candidatus Levybacteria bacterium RIFCSPLOWO2_02_FULL_37_18]